LVKAKAFFLFVLEQNKLHLALLFIWC